MKVTYKKHFILNRRERRRISRFPPSRYCDCVTAPIKFGGLCHVVCLFVCLFSLSHLMKRRSRLSLIKMRELQ